MKKRVILVVIGFVISGSLLGPQRANQSFQPRGGSGGVLNLHNFAAFDSNVKRMAQVYGNGKNPVAFVELLNKRTSDNFTALMYFSAVSAPVEVAFVLDWARRVTGMHPNLFFEIANAQDQDANTPLFLACLSGNVRVIRDLVDNVAAVIGHDKKLFLKFLTNSFGSSGWTALHALAYGSHGEAIEVLVSKAEEVLSKNSEEYNLFINAQDASNGTPLSYAIDPGIRLFLIKHGATIYHSESVERKKASDFGEKLIEAVKNDDIAAFQKIFIELHEVYKNYKNGKGHYLEAVSKRDNDGWNALMHAAAHNRIDYITIFIQQVGDFFKDDRTLIYTILSNTALDGRTALLIAIFRRSFEAADIILDLTQKYSQNKLFFYMALNVVEDYNGFTPLLSAVFNSASGGDEEKFYALIKKMITMIDVYFHGADIFYYFMNTQDLGGNTALSYANVPKIRDLLLDYGAIDPKAHTRMRTRYVG